MCNCKKGGVPTARPINQRPTPRAVVSSRGGNYGGVTPRVTSRRGVVRTK